MKKTVASLFLLIFFTSCIKTADQVNRERQLSNMSHQLSDSQSLVGQLMTQIQSLQNQVETLTGKVEELEHKQSLINPEKIKENNEDIIVLKTQADTTHSQILALQEEVKAQKAFTEKVTDGLKNLSKQQAAAATKPAAAVKTPKQQLNEALQMVVDNKFVSARVILETLIEHKDLSAADHNKVFHGLGRVELYTNNPDKALVYLSKIVMKYPRSSLTPNSLYLIGKSFQKLNKPEEARQAFTKLITDYPNAADVAKAKKEL
ncbi:MAG TPA: tetratricopeptide repeat protein [Bacteriovoracaceae bacterium]|nr:tetratricopeptide repeat protein [Bacteriovoracaceae bacterium]